MVTRSTESETILYSDRVPIYLGVNGFFLKQGIQSSNRSIENPTEVIKEQGNSKNRGITVKSLEVTVSLEDLAVDMDMEQLLAESWAKVGSVAQTATLNSLVYAVGPTDKVTGLVISYQSGANLRVGIGAPMVSATSTSITLASAGHAVNFAVGDNVIVQDEGTTTNASAATCTITAISGATLTTTGFNASGISNSYVYKEDLTPMLAATWVSGAPSKSAKGFEVFCTAAPTSTSGVNLAYYPITSAGVSTAIDSDDFRDSEIDILMLYNDYQDNLIFSRYVQDAAITSIGFNFSADGNATQNYDFSTGKSIDYAGYIIRRSTLASSTTKDLAADVNIFKGSEAHTTIAANTTLNENSFETNFLKVQTITTAGVKKVWKEVASTATPGADEYKYDSDTITFGESVGTNTRLEITYLCDVMAEVAAADAYKFDDTAFNHNGKPVAVEGKYQPLTINPATEDRVDGVESSSINLSFARDYYMAQGIISKRVKPSQIGEVDGSISTREGFSKIMTLLTQGTNEMLTEGQQMDASKAANYTNNNTVPLRVRLYNPADNVTVIKSVDLDKIQVTNITNSNSVGDDSTIEVSFTGTNGNVTFSR